MNEHVRGFPAFAPQRQRSRQFARTWWGRDWLQAMEQAALDQRQLTLGRRTARAGQVGPITVGPGRVAATVDADEGPVRAVIRCPLLSDRDWDRVGALVARSAGHVAALLDGELSRDLADSASDAGVRLLPDIGDLEPDCDCPGWEHPCLHAAAVGYQVAWLLDDDPFVLLLARGRSRDSLVADWHHRQTATTPTTEPTDVDAEDVFAREPAPLPDEPPAVTDPAPALVVDAAEGVDPTALRHVAAHAAHRARDVLAEPSDVDFDDDLVRIAAHHPDSLARWQAASSRGADLPRSVRAWELGGAAGLEVLATSWTPRGSWWTRACTELAEAAADDGLPPPSTWRNRWTAGAVQVRCHPDGRWFAYRRQDEAWWPCATARPDPVAALTAALPS